MSYLDWKDNNEKDCIDSQLEDFILPCFEDTSENEVLAKSIELSVNDSFKKFTDIHPVTIGNVFSEYLYERYKIESADAEYLSELMRVGCERSKKEGIDFVIGSILDSGVDFDWTNFLASINKNKNSTEALPSTSTTCTKAMNTRLGAYMFQYVHVQGKPDWVILTIRYTNHITKTSAVAYERVECTNSSNIRYTILHLASSIATELDKDSDDVNMINELAVKAFSDMGLDLTRGV